jgi:hypothetical protein
VSDGGRARAIGNAKRSWWSEWRIAVPGILLMIAGAVIFLVWRFRPHLTDQEVDGLVTVAIQQEAKAAFLVTGYLDINAQARVENTLRLLPGILNLPVGTTTASVRAPGRVTYGFQISEITPQRITLQKDGVIEVVVPRPMVYTVAPDLEKMEIETTVGWTRLAGDSRAQVQSRALSLLQENMRQQAVQHVRTSKQPDINSADAMYAMLRPVLIAAGLKEPRFRFRIGEDLIMEPHDR